MGRVKREGINFSKGTIWNTGAGFCISECVQLQKGLVAVVVQSRGEFTSFAAFFLSKCKVNVKVIFFWKVISKTLEIMNMKMLT